METRQNSPIGRESWRRPMTITANRDERAVFARLAEAYGTPSVSEALRKAAFREAELLGLTPRGKGK